MPKNAIGGYGLDPYSGEMEEMQRRQQYIEALREQSMQVPPVNRMAGRVAVPISWTEALAPIAKGASAAVQQGRLKEEAQALREKMQARRAQDIAAALRAGAASPAQYEDAAGNYAPQAAVQADPRRTYQSLAMSQDPMLAQMGMQGALPPIPKQQMVPEGGIVLGPDGKPIFENKKDFRTPGFKPGDTRKIVQGDQEIVQEYQADGTWKEIGKGPRFAKQVGTTIINPPAPSMTEIQDPSDPSRMLRIDARAYKGGGLGSPGVIGISGKEPVAAKREEKEGQGKELLKSELDNLRTHFKTLFDKGAITSDAEGGLSNAGAWVRNTAVGQLGGRILGTQEQSARNEIQSSRLRLLNAIKNATGMSAQQLNSNAELKTWLDSLTNMEGSYESNMGIIDAIDRAFMTPRRRASDSAPAPRVVDW